MFHLFKQWHFADDADAVELLVVNCDAYTAVFVGDHDQWQGPRGPRVLRKAALEV